MRHRRLAAAALLMLAVGSAPARASEFLFQFGGSGVRGAVTLTYIDNPNTGSPLGTSPNPFDPIGSYIVTGATGSFRDSNIGLVTTITGVVPRNPANPEPTNLLAPRSFGFYPIANGAGPGGHSPGFSYDNLFYPGGSPQTASDYPFHGGFLDIYGLVFTTASGKAVNFWSDGDFGGGATYGAGVTDGISILDYAGGIGVHSAVPEPASWALMLGGFGLAGAMLRSRRRALSATTA